MSNQGSGKSPGNECSNNVPTSETITSGVCVGRLSVPESTVPSLYACWIIQAVFEALPINQLKLSRVLPGNHKLTSECIYTRQQFDLQLNLYTTCLIKLSGSYTGWQRPGRGKFMQQQKSRRD